MPKLHSLDFVSNPLSEEKPDQGHSEETVLMLEARDLCSMLDAMRYQLVALDKPVASVWLSFSCYQMGIVIPSLLIL